MGKYNFISVYNSISLSWSTWLNYRKCYVVANMLHYCYNPILQLFLIISFRYYCSSLLRFYPICTLTYISLFVDEIQLCTRLHLMQIYIITQLVYKVNTGYGPDDCIKTLQTNFMKKCRLHIWLIPGEI